MELHPSTPPAPASDLSSLRRLRERLAQVPDTRQPGKVLHRLDEVLFSALCALLCDAGSFTDMEDFAQSQLEWLRGFLPLKHGAPSHDVFRNVFMQVKPAAVLDILREWCGPLDGQHLAIDGKTLRGTYDQESGRHLVHLVRAWVDERSLSAGQVLCAQKSNEIEAIPRLLAALELRGATVTIDAIGTQPPIAEQIHEAGADYVLALKANQKGALQAATQAFAHTAPQPPAAASSSSAKRLQKQTLELSHGRCEKREYELLDDISWFDKSWKWPGLQAVGRVRREVQRSHEDPPLVQEHYFLCSFAGEVERFASLVRGHWSVENRCHWVLDVTFGEDHHQLRGQTAAHNLSIFREMTLKLLRDHPAKLSLRRKRRRAALDPIFRLQLLASLHA